MKRIALVLAASLAACGGNSSATGHNNPGTGSSTLLVTADVTASMSSGGPVTSLQVDVRDGMGAKVSGATVAISNGELGSVPLVEANAGSGRYVNSRSSFPAGDFVLSVVRGTDKVEGVVVGGPGVGTVNAPTRNAVVAANQPLALSWTTPSQAKSVTISTRDFEAQGPDTGTYTIPAASNPSRTNQRLILARFNEVDIAGGLSGSRLRVTFTATVDPFVVQ
jgi:hypothetical protein